MPNAHAIHLDGHPCRRQDRLGAHCPLLSRLDVIHLAFVATHPVDEILQATVFNARFPGLQLKQRYPPLLGAK